MLCFYSVALCDLFRMKSALKIIIKIYYNNSFIYKHFFLSLLSFTFFNYLTSVTMCLFNYLLIWFSIMYIMFQHIAGQQSTVAKVVLNLINTYC